MAIIPENEFPGKINPADAKYPYGSARDVSAPGAGDGTPWVAKFVNDIFGFQQALLKAAGITPNGQPDNVEDSEYLRALREVTEGTINELMPAYRVRAHVRFRWAGNAINIISRENIESVIRTGTGQYEIQLIEAAPNNNYEVYPSGAWGGQQGGASINIDGGFAQTNSRFKIRCDWGGDNLPGLYDPSIVNVQVWW